MENQRLVIDFCVHSAEAVLISVLCSTCMASHGDLAANLSQKTTFLGLRLWVVIGLVVGISIVIILFALSLWLISRNKSRRQRPVVAAIPVYSKDIQEVQVDKILPSGSVLVAITDTTQEEKVFVRVGVSRKASGEDFSQDHGQKCSLLQSNLEAANCKEGNPFTTREDLLLGDDETTQALQVGISGNSHFGWGHWFTLRDLQAATDGFSKENVLGEGGYGIVYRGQLSDGSMIAVKSLLNNMGQAEREFRVELEAIGRVQHNNLVRLLGYCMEGTHRMLVYEYVDNGNLEQWLHGASGSLTWENRMKIILGTAKALAYLHEALEPKVVHRDIKSSNILVDSQWNAKVSDFGLAKLLRAGKSHVTTRVMGTFGYVAPEYANTGLLSERSDVYSFGVLLLETITGRDPVDYARPSGEVNLVDWLKVMVGNRCSEEVVDPSLPEKPAPRILKRTLLIAFRCVDPDSEKRPKMGHVVHMLESEDFPFHDVRKLLS